MEEVDSTTSAVGNCSAQFKSEQAVSYSSYSESSILDLVKLRTVMSQDRKRKASSVPVVSIAFRKVVSNEKWYPSFKKVGEPILQVEILGDRHNLVRLGELLFEYYLEEVLGESLNDQLWRFKPNEHGKYSRQALDPILPILSKDMYTTDSDSLCSDDDSSDFPHAPFTIKEGLDLHFKYDEDTPTHLMATIESITPLPEGKTVDQYPAKKADPLEHLVGEKRKRTIFMDEAYPHLKRRLFERGVRLEIGRGSDPVSNTCEHGCWARIWGDPNAAFDRSLESQRPFENLDEAWLCFDRAIVKQVSPGFPESNRTTEEVYRKERNSDPFPALSVTANVLASSLPRSDYPPEMVEDILHLFGFSSPSRSDEDLALRSWIRRCFNFALPKNWQSASDTPDFSFVAQFPKVTTWLTHQCSTSYWLYVERGVLCAVKGKNNPRTAEKVAHRTRKHDTLHAMFAELEERLVLPKSWKLGKKGK